jgi:succinate dehydrogenase flavin-adding protein (antitoxin of CptAB toxin-antitoxin module)
MDYSNFGNFGNFESREDCNKLLQDQKEHYEKLLSEQKELFSQIIDRYNTPEEKDDRDITTIVSNNEPKDSFYNRIVKRFGNQSEQKLPPLLVDSNFKLSDYPRSTKGGKKTKRRKTSRKNKPRKKKTKRH